MSGPCLVSPRGREKGPSFPSSAHSLSTCVLRIQIEGPRGEKGQKGEPAIIEPVRVLSCPLSEIGGGGAVGDAGRGPTRGAPRGHHTPLVAKA